MRPYNTNSTNYKINNEYKLDDVILKSNVQNQIEYLRKINLSRLINLSLFLKLKTLGKLTNSDDNEFQIGTTLLAK